MWRTTVTDRRHSVDEELFGDARGNESCWSTELPVDDGARAVTGPEPVGRVSGLLAPGCIAPASVDLRPGEVWTVGRRDERFLAQRPDRATRHLGVPDPRPDLSVNQLELRVGSLAVAVSSSRSAGVAVDGVIRPSPAVLAAGTSYVSPTVDGLHLDFVVTILAEDTFAAGYDAIPSSGTTLTLRIDLEVDSALWRVAHALAWPCTSAMRRPHVVGWSGRDVAERLTQLGWQSATRNVTTLGQQLHTIAEKVANCLLSDGRRADMVFPSWPPWSEGEPGETRDQRAERRNRVVAEALWRARAVESSVIDGTR